MAWTSELIVIAGVSAKTSGIVGIRSGIKLESVVSCVTTSSIIRDTPFVLNPLLVSIELPI